MSVYDEYRSKLRTADEAAATRGMTAQQILE